jgi:pimeloyl-ACP methyl ester carboxylesterase
MEPGITQGIVRVDGASIYYERRGDGPAVLLISGGQGEAAHFSRAADLLASDYTVLTFDRRGVGRSRLEGPRRQFSMLQQAQDAVAVITAGGFASAAVFGSSSGASIVLELAAAYPEVVSLAISHEPPVITGLPDRGEMLDFYDRVEARAAAGEVVEAWAEHIQRTGLPSLLPRSSAELDPDQLAKLKEFVTGTQPVFTYYRPDYARLSLSQVPLMLAAGHDSLNHFGPGKPVFTARTAQAAAEHIGTELVEFPGNHVVHMVDPVAFVETLRPLLQRASNQAPAPAA